MVERSRKPQTLVVLAVVCLASAAGNGLYDNGFSNVVTVVFSVLGSLLLTAAAVAAATSPARGDLGPGMSRHGTGPRRLTGFRRSSARAERPNLYGNMGGGAGVSGGP